MIRITLPRRRRALLALGAVVLALALLVGGVAAAGGFERGELRAAQRAQVGEPIRVGPFELTVTAAYTTPDDVGAYFPRTDDGDPLPGMQSLVLEVEIENVEDEPQYGATAADAVHQPSDARICETSSGTEDAAALYSRGDELIDVINPGVRVQGRFAWPQEAVWIGDEVAIAFTDLAWIEEDVLTLSDESWMPTDDVIFTVTVPVEARDGEGEP